MQEARLYILYIPLALINKGELHLPSPRNDFQFTICTSPCAHPQVTSDQEGVEIECYIREGNNTAYLVVNVVVSPPPLPAAMEMRNAECWLLTKEGTWTRCLYTWPPTPA